MELIEFNLAPGGKVAINPQYVMVVIEASDVEERNYGECVMIKMSNGDNFAVADKYSSVSSRLCVSKKETY